VLYLRADFRTSIQLQIKISSDYFRCVQSHARGLAFRELDIAHLAMIGGSPIADPLHRLRLLHRYLPVRRHATTSTMYQLHDLLQRRLRHTDEKAKCSSFESQLLFTPEYLGMLQYISTSNSPDTRGCVITLLPQIYSVTW
jgi:hypothetical protein